VPKLVPGTPVRLRGRLHRGDFHVRAYDLGEISATADYAPVYPAGEEITPKKLRALVDQVLPLTRCVPDPLPAGMGRRLRPAQGDRCHAAGRGPPRCGAAL
jgi:RecG-like helicase